ncbi:MAG: hypothetical protein KKD39_02385 [Candidatus Altiarchaeota archaeon]|nr:hypothetical protein [Candidatus Altiarchaeota archaeon]
MMPPITPGERNSSSEPQLPALLHGPQDIGAIMKRIQSESELQKKSYLDMVPQELRRHVKHIAEAAFPTMAQGRDMEEFTNVMALNWLAKREAFTELARTSTFTSVGSNILDRDADTAGMALTSSASIIVFSEPFEGQRDIAYLRISEREAVSIPPLAKGNFHEDLVVGSRVYWNDSNSSPLIRLYANPTAAVDVHQTCSRMNESFIDIDHRTIRKSKT